MKLSLAEDSVVMIVYKFNLYRQDQIWVAHENATSCVRAAASPGVTRSPARVSRVLSAVLPAS
jgi:hypothetical protein